MLDSVKCASTASNTGDTRQRRAQQLLHDRLVFLVDGRQRDGDGRRGVRLVELGLFQMQLHLDGIVQQLSVQPAALSIVQRLVMLRGAREIAARCELVWAR